MTYVVHLLTLSCINLMLAVSLDLLVGFAGLLSLAHAVFFGVGAYTTAILVREGVGGFNAMMLGAVFAALASSFIALPSTRVRGIYLLILTIAVQSVFTVMLLNLSGITGGPAGISKIAPFILFGYPLRGIEFTIFMAICSTLVLLFSYRLGQSPFGHLLQAIRDDETGCAILGKNVSLAKISAFALSGALAAIAGSFYAHYTSYVDPRGFDILVSISVLLMVMLGGAGTIFGPAIGAFIVTIIPELLRFIPAPLGAAGASRQLSYGLLLILIIFFRPQGLLGRGVPNNHAN